MLDKPRDSSSETPPSASVVNPEIPLSPEEIKAVEKVPSKLRQITLPLRGKATALVAFDQFRVDNMRRSNPSGEGGCVFYRAPDGSQYTLKFFNGSMDGKRAEMYQWTEEKKHKHWEKDLDYKQHMERFLRIERNISDPEEFERELNEAMVKRPPFTNTYSSEDLWTFARGFAMARWLATRHEPYFLPIVDQGVVDYFGTAASDPSYEQVKIALGPQPKSSVPYVVFPYLTIKNSGPITDSYRDIHFMNLDEQYLAEGQDKLAPEFQGKSVAEIQRVIRDKLQAIVQMVERRYAIILRDIEPHINLTTGNIKILDTGISIPAEKPQAALLLYLSKLFDLTPNQIQTIATKHQDSTDVAWARQGK